MNKNFIISLLILLLLVNGWAFVYFQLPFYEETIVLAGLSLLLMTFIHQRFVFVYSIAMVIGFAAFLTGYAFMYEQPADVQVLYIYDHLLFTSFIFLHWILLHYAKAIGYENNELKQQVKLLRRYTEHTKILTRQEFLEQAKWVLNSVRRSKQQAWLVELSMTYKSKLTEQTLQEKIEEICLKTVRHQFDLITYHEKSVFLLLRDTNRMGVNTVLNRIEAQVRQTLNIVELPYGVSVQLVEDEETLTKKIRESSK